MFNLTSLTKVFGLSMAILAVTALVPANAIACDTCGCSAGQETVGAADKSNTVVDVAVDAGSFKTLVTAVKAAGLVDTLNSKGPFTVFAPTDEAFAKLPKAELQRLLKPENKAELVGILTYHVVPGKVMAADVVKVNAAPTVNGQSMNIRVENGKVFVNGARVVKTDISASNGVIHVIDSVILPRTSPDIVDTAVKAGSFKTLISALKAAGLTDTLKGNGPFTVFAPTDEAFAKIPAETLASLLKPENKAKLQAILTYHVVSGEMMAASVVKENSTKTVNGQALGIKVKKGQVFIGDARVVKADIEARNGVIHVIDTVLLPN